MKSPAPATVRDYLDQVASLDNRRALEHLRSVILEEVPDAQEVISYGIPTYKYNKTSVSVAAFKSHCSFFPGYAVQEFTEQLKEFKTSTGTVQFTPDRPIPDALVRAILKARFWSGKS